jgi:hypothetical protein
VISFILVMENTSDPKNVNSAASSGVIELNNRAVGTFRGSAVKIPSTSFHICSSSAPSPTATKAAHKSVYPRPIADNRDPGTIPKYPVTTGTPPPHFKISSAMETASFE